MAIGEQKEARLTVQERAAGPGALKTQDMRVLLDEVEQKIDELKIQYEQFFLGVSPLPPEKLHQLVKRDLRALHKLPLKNSALHFRMRTIWNRYQTHFTYWQRVLRERENGTYSRDVFKADLRERNTLEDKRAQTQAGAAEKGFKELFKSYKLALEKSSGAKHAIDFQTFQKNIIQRSKELKERTGARKVSFKVVVKEGKVTLQAVAKND